LPTIESRTSEVNRALAAVVDTAMEIRGHYYGFCVWFA